jgi:hypothetical protein
MQVEKHGWEFTFKPVLDYINTVAPAHMWLEFDLELQVCRAVPAPLA